MGTITKIMSAVTTPEATRDRADSNPASKRWIIAVAGDVTLMNSHSAPDLELSYLQGFGRGCLWLPQAKQGQRPSPEIDSFHSGDP